MFLNEVDHRQSSEQSERRFELSKANTNDRVRTISTAQKWVKITRQETERVYDTINNFRDENPNSRETTEGNGSTVYARAAFPNHGWIGATVKIHDS